jgi:hypothetical protein
LPVDAGDDGVDAGGGLDGANDGVVEVVGRGSLVSASKGEFGSELIERDTGVEEFGLQAAEGVTFGFVGERVQVAGGVEGGLGAEAGRGEVGEFGRHREFGVLVVGEPRVDRPAASGVEVAAVPADP